MQKAQGCLPVFGYSTEIMVINTLTTKEMTALLEAAYCLVWLWVLCGSGSIQGQKVTPGSYVCIVCDTDKGAARVHGAGLLVIAHFLHMPEVDPSCRRGQTLRWSQATCSGPLIDEFRRTDPVATKKPRRAACFQMEVGGDAKRSAREVGLAESSNGPRNEGVRSVSLSSALVVGGR